MVVYFSIWNLHLFPLSFETPSYWFRKKQKRKQINPKAQREWQCNSPVSKRSQNFCKTKNRWMSLKPNGERWRKLQLRVLMSRLTQWEKTDLPWSTQKHQVWRKMDSKNRLEKRINWKSTDGTVNSLPLTYSHAERSKVRSLSPRERKRHPLDMVNKLSVKKQGGRYSN